MCLWSAIGKVARLHRVVSRHRSQPGEAQGHFQVELANQTEGRTEANGLHGSTQPFRFPPRGTGNALLQAPKETRQVPVDTRSATSLRQAQGISDLSTCVGSTHAGRAIAVIHCSNLTRGQHGCSYRAQRGRPHPESSAPSVLRQRSPERVKSKVSPSSENSICCANHVSEASALLPGASHNGVHKLPDW